MSENGVIPVDQIESIIFLIRGQKVMLSPHLAELYNVEPRVLVQAVKRNIDRFPGDFMFQLSDDEFFNLKSQLVTSSWGGPRRAKPYAFTEHLKVRNPNSSRSILDFFYREANLLFLCFRRSHELPDRLEDDLKLFIIFLFHFKQFGSQFGVRCQ